MRLFLALLPFFLLLLALPAHAAECETTYDCGYRESCKSGACVFDGFSCKYDSECDPFEFCNTGAYQCQVSPGRCHTASDCLGGKACDANNYCALGGEAPSGSNSSGIPFLNSTANASIGGFGSTDPAINRSIQKMKQSVNGSIASAEQKSAGSVGGFFEFFFAFLRRLIFGG